jgi:hypothetical protein
MHILLDLEQRAMQRRNDLLAISAHGTGVSAQSNRLNIDGSLTLLCHWKMLPLPALGRKSAQFMCYRIRYVQQPAILVRCGRPPLSRKVMESSPHRSRVRC